MNHQKISKADNSSPHLKLRVRKTLKRKTIRAEAALLVPYSAIRNYLHKTLSPIPKENLQSGLLKEVCSDGKGEWERGNNEPLSPIRRSLMR